MSAPAKPVSIAERLARLEALEEVATEDRKAMRASLSTLDTKIDTLSSAIAARENQLAGALTATRWIKSAAATIIVAAISGVGWLYTHGAKLLAAPLRPPGT